MIKTTLPAFSFGDTPEMADDLLALVLEGRKTATCSALASYKDDEARMPRKGQRYRILNGQGQCACIIEITQVDIGTFADIDEKFAFLEGEGDLSLAYWQQEHRSFFERSGFFAENMKLVCEHFKVVERILK